MFTHHRRPLRAEQREEGFHGGQPVVDDGRTQVGAKASFLVNTASSAARSAGKSTLRRGRPVRVFPEVVSEGCRRPGAVFPEGTTAVYFWKCPFPEVEHPRWAPGGGASGA